LPPPQPTRCCDPAWPRGADDVFGWEVAHRDDRRRRSRKFMQLAVDLGTFCVPAFSAIVVFWVNGPLTGAFVAASVVECAVVMILAAQLVGYADLRRSTDRLTAEIHRDRAPEH